MKTLHEVAEDHLNVIRANGFEDPLWATNFGWKVALIHTECDEAIDGVLGSGKDPLEEELADIVIRATGCLQAIWPNTWADRTTSAHDKINVYRDIDVLLRPIRKQTTLAMEAWRKANDKDARSALEMVVKETFALSDALRFDMRAELDKKLAKNSKREFRHGTARSEG